VRPRFRALIPTEREPANYPAIDVSAGSSAEMPLLGDGNDLAQLSDLHAPLIHILDVFNQYIIGLVRQIMVE
jgi:hypothetical protein